MPHAARIILRRLAVVSLILLTLAGGMLAAPAQAGTCAPDREAATLTTASVLHGPGDCRDCSVACAHGCCHAPVVGLLAATPLAPEPPRFTPPSDWADTPGIPLGERTELYRPPRA